MPVAAFRLAALRYVVLFVAILAGVALLVPAWKYADLWLLATLVDGAQDREIDDQVVPIDLNAGLGRVRKPLLELLGEICGSTGAEFRCDRPARELPSVVAIDVEFFANAGDPAQVRRLSQAVSALYDRGISVYGSILPYNQPGIAQARDAAGAPVEELDQHFSGFGHTQLFTLPLFPSVAWYEPTLLLPSGQELQALPLSIQEGISGHANLAASSQQTRVFSVGSHAAFLGAVRTVPLDSSRRKFSKFDWLVIGDLPAEKAALSKRPGGAAARDRTGFELVTWAISDFKRQLVQRRFATLDDSRLMIAMVVQSSALAVILFRFAFARLRTRRYCYALSFLAASAGSFAALVILVGALYASGTVYSRVSLVCCGIVTASALAARQAADDERHLRFLTSVASEARAKRAGALRYDVFVSYAHEPENTRWIEEQVLGILSAARGPDGELLRIFFDRESLGVGTLWYDRISEAVQTSRYFVPIYSKTYFQRWFCRDEIELALLRLEQSPDFIVPVSRVGPRIPRRYADLQYVDAVRDREFMAKVLRAVGGSKGKPDPASKG
jgi:hypothetical protein